MNTHPYESLTPDTVLDAVEAAGYVLDGRLMALNSYENRVYQVGIDEQRPVIAKFYRPGRWTEAQIREEHEFSLELVEGEVPVVAPLHLAASLPEGLSVDSGAGDTLGHFGGFRFALFPQRGGQAPDTSVPDLLYRLGQWLGQFHNIGARKVFSERDAIGICEGIAANNDYLLTHGWVPADLRPAWESLIPHLVTLCEQRIAEAGEVEYLRIHGDCHAGNLLVRDDSILIVDLDDCKSGPAIQDLWLLLNGDRLERADQFAELLEGYEMFRDFNRRERHLIEPLRCFRQLAHCRWLASRWEDPAFPRFFPWFGQPRFWSDQILSLREQLSALQEPSLSLPGQMGS